MLVSGKKLEPGVWFVKMNKMLITEKKVDKNNDNFCQRTTIKFFFEP
jgi:hypothetical protein